MKRSGMVYDATDTLSAPTAWTTLQRIAQTSLVRFPTGRRPSWDGRPNPPPRDLGSLSVNEMKYGRGTRRLERILYQWPQCPCAKARCACQPGVHIKSLKGRLQMVSWP